MGNLHTPIKSRIFSSQSLKFQQLKIRLTMKKSTLFFCYLRHDSSVALRKNQQTGATGATGEIETLTKPSPENTPAAV